METPYPLRLEDIEHCIALLAQLHPNAQRMGQSVHEITLDDLTVSYMSEVTGELFQCWFKRDSSHPPTFYSHVEDYSFDETRSRPQERITCVYDTNEAFEQILYDEHLTVCDSCRPIR